MASRTLSVALRALVQGYTAPMRRAAAATGTLEASLLRVQRTGAGMASVGATLTRRVSLPLAAVGAVAAKMSIDFDTSMSRIAGLTALSADEVDGLRSSVLDLAGETTKSPRELADALFVVASAGATGDEAMRILEASAKASAAGLGEVDEIARATVSAVNAYGTGVLSAAEATDIITATAKAGNFEVSQLAGALGRVLPTAKEAGVSFADVGGAVALLTRTSGDAGQAVTQVDSLLRGLVRPTQESRKQLEQMGLSVEDLRTSLDQRGLRGTLEFLDATLQANGLTMDQFLRRSEAQAAASVVLGASQKDLADTIGVTGDAIGSVDNAFAEFAKSSGFQAKQSFAELQIALIKIGDVIVPIASEVLGFAGSLLEEFNKLPGPIKQAAVAFGIFAVAIGPLLSIGGNLALVFGKLAMGMTNFVAPAGAVSGAFRQVDTAAAGAATSAGRLRVSTGGLALGIAVAIPLAMELGDALGNALNPLRTAEVAKLERDLLQLGQGLKSGAELAGLAGDDFDKLADAFRRVSDPSVSNRLRDVSNKITSLGKDTKDLRQARQDIDDIDKALASLATRDPDSATAAVDALTAKLEAQGVSADTVLELLDDYGAATASIDTANAVADVSDLADGLGDQADAADDARTALESYADAVRATFDPLFAMSDALGKNEEAQAAVTEAQDALNAAVAEYGPTSAEAAEAEAALSDAHRNAAGSALDVTSATAALKAAVDDGSVSVDEAASTLALWSEQGLISKETAFLMAVEFAGAADEADNLAGDYQVKIDAETATARRRLVDARDLVDSIDGRVATVSVRTQFFGGAFQQVRDLLGRRASGGPVARGRTYVVGEHGPELATFGSDGRVLSHADAMRAVAQSAVPSAGGGAPSKVTVSFGGSGALWDAFMLAVRRGEVQMQVDGQRVRAA